LEEVKKPIRVIGIKIRNIAGLSEYEITPGQVTLIEGKNEKGKTSAQNGLLSVIEGGYSATLLKRGETEGEVVIVLDDDTTISKKFTDKGQTTTVRQGKFKSNTPMGVIHELFGTMTFNPVSFMDMQPKERIDSFLSSIDLKITPDDLEKILHTPGPKNINYEQHGLKVLDQTYNMLFETRTEENRNANSLRTTIDRMGQGIIDIPEDSEEQLKKLQTEIDELTLSNINIGKDLAEKSSSFNLDELKEIQEIKDKYRKKKEIAEKNAYELANYNNTLIESKKAVLLPLETKQKQKEAQVVVKTEIEKMKVTCTEHETSAVALTGQLEQILAYKKSFSEELTIAGMSCTIEDDVCVNGVPFTSLNTANQIIFAMSLAAKHTGKVPFTVIDGIERLDSEHLDILIAEAEKYGLQLMMFKVADKPLTESTLREFPKTELETIIQQSPEIVPIIKQILAEQEQSKPVEPVTTVTSQVPKQPEITITNI
jgi:hypothetical protein